MKHWVQPTKAYFTTLQTKKDFQVSLVGSCGQVVNPLLDVHVFLSKSRTFSNSGNYDDPELDKLYDAMNRSPDPAAQRRLMRKFEKRALDEQAHHLIVLWWYRIVPHRAVVRGWKISPSHYLNQDLGNVWLAQ